MCLTECCRARQAGDMPLHLAAMNGHALVVEQLLAAGAVRDAMTKVRLAGDGRVEGRRVAWCGFFFSGCCWFSHPVMW